MMDVQPRRRWFRFSIATMLWIIALLSLGFIAYRESRIRAELEIENAQLRNHISKLEAPRPPFPRQLKIDLGAPPVRLDKNQSLFLPR